MNFTRTGLAAVVLVAGLSGSVRAASGSDDTLVRAKSLYAAAAYGAIRPLARQELHDSHIV